MLQSLYSRCYNKNRIHVGEHLSVGKKKELYMGTMEQKNWPKVSVDMYRGIFSENVNMGFKLLQIDTRSMR
jgi:hypothetical protein